MTVSLVSGCEFVEAMKRSFASGVTIFLVESPKDDVSQMMVNPSFLTRSALDGEQDGDVLDDGFMTRVDSLIRTPEEAVGVDLKDPRRGSLLLEGVGEKELLEEEELETEDLDGDVDGERREEPVTMGD